MLSFPPSPVLLGTDSGTLVSLDLADPRKERVQPLHSLQGQSVHSVEQTVSPATGKLLVLALTPSHIHCFHGEGSLQDCFSGEAMVWKEGGRKMVVGRGQEDSAAINEHSGSLGTDVKRQWGLASYRQQHLSTVVTRPTPALILAVTPLPPDTIGSPTGLELPSAPGPTQMTLLFGEPDPAAASRSNAGPEGALLSQPSVSALGGGGCGHWVEERRARPVRLAL